MIGMRGSASCRPWNQVNRGSFKDRKDFRTVHEAEIGNCLAGNERNDVEPDIDGDLHQDLRRKDMFNSALQVISCAALFRAVFFQSYIYPANAYVKIDIVVGRFSRHQICGSNLYECNAAVTPLN